MISARLAEALTTFATTLTTDFVAEDALAGLMAVVPDELEVDGAGIMLHDDDDELRFVAASDETVRLIERFQVETGDGPCVRASVSGEQVFADDLEGGDDRFPDFAKLAVAAGLRSVHAFPMVMEGHRVGAMNLYRAEPGPLSAEAKESGHLFAAMATAYLFGARRLDHTTRMLLGIRQSLDRSAPIEQAKGYLARALDVPVDQGFEILRRYARNERIRVAEVAERVLAGALDPTELG